MSDNLVCFQEKFLSEQQEVLSKCYEERRSLAAERAELSVLQKRALEREKRETQKSLQVRGRRRRGGEGGGRDGRRERWEGRGGGEERGEGGGEGGGEEGGEGGGEEKGRRREGEGEERGGRSGREGGYTHPKKLSSLLLSVGGSRNGDVSLSSERGEYEDSNGECQGEGGGRKSEVGEGGVGER